MLFRILKAARNLPSLFYLFLEGMPFLGGGELLWARLCLPCPCDMPGTLHISHTCLVKAWLVTAKSDSQSAGTSIWLCSLLLPLPPILSPFWFLLIFPTLNVIGCSIPRTLFFSVYTLSLGDLICLRSLNPIYKLTYLKCISAAQTFLQLQTFPQLPTFISDGLCNRHLKCNTSKFKLFISKLPKVPVYWLSISINGTSIFLQLKENSVFLTSYLC